MIRTQHLEGVTRLEFSHWRSRAVGLSVSAYLVRGVLIDSGFAAIGPELARLVREIGPLRGALITHWHEDHSGNAELLARLGVAIGASEETLDRLRHPKRIGLYRRFTWGTPRRLASPVQAFADDSLRLVSAPGHSIDHHVVWDASEGDVYSADLFLGVRVGVAHAYERPRETVRSLRAVIALGPRRLFDAHRGPVRNPAGALSAKVAWMEETLGRIDDLARRGVGARAIQHEVLGREGWLGLLSAGDYSKANYVRAALREARENPRPPVRERGGSRDGEPPRSRPVERPRE